MYVKQLHEMTAAEIASIQEQERQEAEIARANRAQIDQVLAEREARLAAQTKIETEIRLGKRLARTATAADDQYDVLLEILGDRADAFAIAFAGANPHELHQRFHSRTAALHPRTRAGNAAHAIVEQAQSVIRRRIELAEGAL